MQALDGSMAAKSQSIGNGTSRGCREMIILGIHFVAAKAAEPSGKAFQVRIGHGQWEPFGEQGEP